MRLLAELADDLLAGRMPSREAALFVAGALSAWLRDGRRCGDLERAYLRVTPREHSTVTPQRLHARGSARRATADDDAATVEADLSGDEHGSEA